MNTQKEIGLFFGSFNPIHTGHLIIAQHVAQFSDCDEVWLVVSPQNPLKDKQSLEGDHDRLHLVRLAIEDHPLLRASSIEFGLPRPSYTVDTMVHLREKYPEVQFSLLMGGDNLQSFHKWKNHEILLRDYKIYLYKRPGYAAGQYLDHPSVKVVEAPQMNISATFIRKCIKESKSIRYLVPDAVFEYLEKTNLYR